MPGVRCEIDPHPQYKIQLIVFRNLKEQMGFTLKHLFFLWMQAAWWKVYPAGVRSPTVIWSKTIPLSKILVMTKASISISLTTYGISYRPNDNLTDTSLHFLTCRAVPSDDGTGIVIKSSALVSICYACSSLRWRIK